MLRDQKNSTFPVKEAMQESKTESVKNRTECKDKFFRDTRTPRIRKLKTNESYKNPDAYCQKFADPYHVL